MAGKLNVLIIDDSEDDALLVLQELRRGGYDPSWERVDTAEAMASALEQGRWDLVLSDHQMPHFDSLAALTVLNKTGKDIPFIIVSGQIGEDTAVLAMRSGAADYIRKGNLTRLLPAIGRELVEADVRRQKRSTEALLQKSEARYRTIAEDAPVLICRFLPDGTLSYANGAYCDMFGRKSEELIGSSFRPLIHPDDLEGVEDAFRTITENEPVVKIENRVYAADGSVRWMRWTDRAIFHQGKLAEFQAVGEDITEDRLVKEALRASEERYRLLVENIGDAVLLTAPGGSILSVNEAGCRMFGRTEEEICRLGRAGIIDIADPRLPAALEERARTGRFRGELTGLRASGEKFPIEVSTSLFKDRSGEVRTAMIISDISERVRSEQLLRQKDELLGLTGEMGHIGGWEFDVATGAGTWTDEVARIHDLDPANPASAGLGLSVYAGAMREKIDAAIRAAVEHARPYDLELEMTSMRGVRKWVRTMGIPIAEDGRVVRIRGIFQDITERIRAEAAIRESEERLRFALETSHTGAWDLDLEDHTALRSLEHDRIFGYGEMLPEWTFEMFLEHVLPEDRGMVREKFQHAVDTGTDWNFECRIRRVDGALRWIWAAGRHRSIGGRTRMAGIVQDITGRKEAEEALRLRGAALESAANAILITDRDGAIQWANRAFMDLTGYDEREVAGRNPREIVRSGAHDREYYRGMWETILGGGTWHGEIINRRKDGTRYDEEMTIAPVTDSAGAITHFVAVKNDITGRKRAEARIRKINRVYTVLSNINEAIVRIGDLDELFRESCRIAVEDGKFIMAWIGMLDGVTRSVSPRAWAGHTGDYIDSLDITADDVPRGRGPTGTAVREDHFVICGDIGSDESVGPWRDRMMSMGYRSSAAFPLRIRGGPVGAINLYSSEKNFFDAEEIRLLNDLASDISFAMEAAEREGLRIKAEETLRESEEMYRLLADNMDDIVWTMGLDLRTTYVSPSVMKVLGFTPEERMSQSPSGQVTPESYDQIMHRLGEEMKLEEQGAAGGSRSITMELEFYRKDGTTVWLESVITGIRDADGRIERLLGVSRDITERRRINASLLEKSRQLELSEQKARNQFQFLYVVINSINAPIFFKDEGGNYSGCNSAFEEFVDLPMSEIVGKTVYDLWPPDLAESYDRMDRELLASGMAQAYEARAVAADGSEHFVLFQKSVYHDTRDAAAGIVGVMLDITDRKRAEEAVRESERFAQSTVNALDANIAILDGTGEIISVNRAWREFALENGGEQARVFENANYLTVCDSATGAGSEGAAEFAAGIRSVMIGDAEAYMMEYPCNAPLAERWFVGKVTRFPGEGPLRIVVAHTEITERKLAEEKIAASLREKEVLLREIHHRVKNNMQVISSLIGLQNSYITRGADVGAALGEMQNRIKSMAIVHEKLYRSENLARIDFREYVTSLSMSIFQSLSVDPDRIALRLDVGAVTLGIDEAVPCGLLVNELVTNALKHGFPGGRTGVIVVSMTDTGGGSYRISVRDDGIGLPAGFDAAVAGSLGVRLIGILTKQIGGSLEVRSEKGGGAEFIITFPAGKEVRPHEG